MKRLNLWNLLVLMLMATMFVGVTACGGDDEDDDAITEGNIIGSWLCTASTDSWDGKTKSGLMALLIKTVVFITSNSKMAAILLNI